MLLSPRQQSIMHSDPNSISNSRAASVTSQLGRQWLQSTNSVPPAEPTSAGTTSTPPGLVVVAFPDVSDVFDTTQGEFDSPDEDADQLAAALAIANQELQTHHTTNGTRNSDSASESGIRIAAHVAPNADLAEPSTDWTDRPANPNTTRSTDPANPVDPGKTSSPESTEAASSEAIQKLTGAILERFPLGDPTVLSFVGSESNSHIEETCARVASELARRKVGRVLLIDAEPQNKSLSKASGVETETGITDVVNHSLDWESQIFGRSVTGLDFLGAGLGVFSPGKSEQRLRQIVAEMKREYQFICVAAGDAHHESARIWNETSDGSYLLVSVKNSNEAHAKSAVAEMRNGGARLLGCVVTDVD